MEEQGIGTRTGAARSAWARRAPRTNSPDARGTQTPRGATSRSRPGLRGTGRCRPHGPSAVYAP
eukprot:9768389-Lingulodinium_polyedra.AAC.1